MVMGIFRLLMLLFISSIIITGCNNTNDMEKEVVASDAVYFDFKIWGEEGKEDVTVLLQFRENDKEGNTLVLEPESKVELDGEKLQVDSAGFTGAFYEVQKPLNEFAGKHTIVFTNFNGEKITEEFEFLPFSITEDLAPSLKRNDLSINISGLKPVDTLRVIVTDTSFKSSDINEMITVNKGQLLITPQLLKNVVNGPVTLDIYKETERELKSTKEGGFLSVTFGLKREFILED